MMVHFSMSLTVVFRTLISIVVLSTVSGASDVEGTHLLRASAQNQRSLQTYTELPHGVNFGLVDEYPNDELVGKYILKGVKAGEKVTCAGIDKDPGATDPPKFGLYNPYTLSVRFGQAPSLTVIGSSSRSCASWSRRCDK